MADRDFPLPRSPGSGRAPLCVLLSVLLLLLSIAAQAQLPGKKPKEFAPVVPDFEAPSADWWTGWPDATLEQRQQWLEELDKGWVKWSETLPESEELAGARDKVNQQIQNINKVWKRRAELLKTSVLPKLEFPEDPSVLDWAKVDAGVARGHQRLSSLQLEARQLEETLAQSLNQLRQQVVVLRESASDPAKKVSASLALLGAQLNHLRIIEQRNALNAQLNTWEEELDHAESELERLLQQVQYSKKAAQELEKAIDTQRDKIEQVTGRRAKLQSALMESSEPASNLEKELGVMALETEALEIQLQQRKSELLQSMNNVLQEGGEERTLSLSPDLVENARGLAANISRELNLRQRQVVAWAGENTELMRRWWGSFERVDSALGRIDDLIEDVLRYETAQLKIYRQHQGWWATVRERSGHWFRQAQQGWRGLADYKLFTISENPFTPRLLAKIILTLFCAWLASRVIGWFLRHMVRKKRASEHTMYNLTRVLHYIIIAAAFVVILAMIGLDTSKLALIAGALSVGIGFGMQAIFSNFISGLILLFEQPLRVGDLVELESGVFGRIRDINVRSTRITTRDNVDILVPNSEFVTGRVINHTLDDPVRRIHIPFGVAYGADPDMVRDAAVAAAERVSITHTDWQRKTEVWLSEFGDSALMFKLVVWVNSNMVSPLGDAPAMYNLELLRELRERDIEIPFPQRDLHLRSSDIPLGDLRRQGG